VLSLAAAGFSAAHAATFDVDFNNIYSFGEKGNEGNTTLSFDLGPLSHITGFSWNVNVTAFDPSWLSELTVELTNSSGEGFSLRPVDDVDASGTQSASGSVDLLNSGLAFYTRADGRLQMEFFEFYNDFADAVDGRWNSGRFSIIYTPIPEPATMALFGAGLLAVLSRGRRRLCTAAPAG
jgi:hypothetical protein